MFLRPDACLKNFCFVRTPDALPYRFGCPNVRGGFTAAVIKPKIDFRDFIKVSLVFIRILY